MVTTRSSSIRASARRRTLTPEPRREAALLCGVQGGAGRQVSCVSRDFPLRRVEHTRGALPKFYPLICSFVWLQRCSVTGSTVTACIVIGDFLSAQEMFMPPPRRAVPPTKREQPPPSAEMLAKVSKVRVVLARDGGFS